MTRPRAERIQASRRPRLARFCADDRGSSVVQYAITFPLILLMMLAAVQAAFYFLGRSVAAEAAQAAVNAERAYGATPGAGSARATEYLDQMGQWIAGPEGVTVTGDANTVTVTVTGQVYTLIPGISWPITQSAHGPREQVTRP